MRLSDKEVQAIKDCFRNIFHSGEIYLFGSRVDDSKKGGDIDLYIRTDEREDLAYKKIKFLTSLKREI